MRNNWLLPDHIADMLPRQTRVLEQMRTRTLELMRSHGFEVIRPPMFEFLDSLITGTGNKLDRQTIKFVDESSGRMMGFRADITPQVARVDAHILNRPGITRLCYAGSVLHAKARHPLATRQPYVVGAEMFGATGPESDLQMVRLAVETQRRIGIGRVRLLIGNPQIIREILCADKAAGDDVRSQVVAALGDKDPVELDLATATLSADTRRRLSELCLLYGDESVFPRLHELCRGNDAAADAARHLQWIAERCGADEVIIDCASVTGFNYYTGISFAGLVDGLPEPVLRGGRYDGIGLAFGRFRPAVGFTLYLRDIAITVDLPLPEAVIAPVVDDAALDELVGRLRAEGTIVVRLLPGEDALGLKESFVVSGKIVFEQGKWAVKPLPLDSV